MPYSLDDSTFAGWPHEVIIHILSYLDVNSLSKVAVVSQVMKNLSCDSNLWKHMLGSLISDVNTLPDGTEHYAFFSEYGPLLKLLKASRATKHRLFANNDRKAILAKAIPAGLDVVVAKVFADITFADFEQLLNEMGRHRVESRIGDREMVHEKETRTWIENDETLLVLIAQARHPGILKTCLDFLAKNEEGEEREERTKSSIQKTRSHLAALMLNYRWFAGLQMVSDAEPDEQFFDLHDIYNPRRNLIFQTWRSMQVEGLPANEIDTMLEYFKTRSIHEKFYMLSAGKLWYSAFCNGDTDLLQTLMDSIPEELRSRFIVWNNHLEGNQSILLSALESGQRQSINWALEQLCQYGGADVAFSESYATELLFAASKLEDDSLRDEVVSLIPVETKRHIFSITRICRWFLGRLEIKIEKLYSVKIERLALHFRSGCYYPSISDETERKVIKHELDIRPGTQWLFRQFYEGIHGKFFLHYFSNAIRAGEFFKAEWVWSLFSACDKDESYKMLMSYMDKELNRQFSFCKVDLKIFSLAWNIAGTGTTPEKAAFYRGEFEKVLLASLGTPKKGAEQRYPHFAEDLECLLTLTDIFKDDPLLARKIGWVLQGRIQDTELEREDDTELAERFFAMADDFDTCSEVVSIPTHGA